MESIIPPHNEKNQKILLLKNVLLFKHLRCQKTFFRLWTGDLLLFLINEVILLSLTEECKSIVSSIKTK